MEIRKIFRSGNSLALTIPSYFAQMLGVKQGDQVSLSIGDGGKIEIRLWEKKVTKHRKEISTHGP